MMKQGAASRPWEVAVLPAGEHLYYCNGQAWHDAPLSPHQLFWHKGEEGPGPGWLCTVCHLDAHGFIEVSAATVQEWMSRPLYDELVRRGVACPLDKE